MVKSPVTIEQKSLFDSAVKKNTAAVTPAARPTPSLSLSAGLSKDRLKEEGMYFLRILSNQYSRGLPALQVKSDLKHVLRTEISIKQGKISLELGVKDVLLRRYGKAL